MAKNIQQIIENYNEAPLTETMNAQKINRHHVPARANKRINDVVNKPGNTTQDVAYDELKKAVIEKKDKKRSRTNKVVKGQVKRAQKIKENENALLESLKEHYIAVSRIEGPTKPYINNKKTKMKRANNKIIAMKNGEAPVNPSTYTGDIKEK